MDYRGVIERCGWYLPTYLKGWRELGADGSDDLTCIVAANHLEAVVECEEVDFDFLISCMGTEEVDVEVEAETKEESEKKKEAETEAEVQIEAEIETETKSLEADLIDKFLSLDDFRIVLSNDEDVEVEQDWELVDVEVENDPKDEFVSEELAQIYMKQGLYDEAKEIYSKLSLQYSEKSIYFAELTKRLSEKEGK